VTTEHTEEPKHNHSTSQDTESNRQSSNADADWILTVHIEGLGRPEEQDGEEVGAGDECDDEGQDQDTGCLLQAGREHGEFGEFGFPDTEGDEHEEADEEGYEDVGGFPGILKPLLAVVIVRLCRGGEE